MNRELVLAVAIVLALGVIFYTADLLTGMAISGPSKALTLPALPAYSAPCTKYTCHGCMDQRSCNAIKECEWVSTPNASCRAKGYDVRGNLPWNGWQQMEYTIHSSEIAKTWKGLENNVKSPVPDFLYNNFPDDLCLKNGYFTSSGVTYYNVIEYYSSKDCTGSPKLVQPVVESVTDWQSPQIKDMSKKCALTNSYAPVVIPYSSYSTAPSITLYNPYGGGVRVRTVDIAITCLRFERFKGTYTGIYE